MCDCQSTITLAAEVLKKALARKEQLIAKLNEKHGIDPAAYFQDEKILETEQKLEALFSSGQPFNPMRADRLFEAYDRLLDRAVVYFVRHVRTLKMRKRSPAEIRQQRLNHLVRDIGAGRVIDYEEFAQRYEQLFGS